MTADAYLVTAKETQHLLDLPFCQKLAWLAVQPKGENHRHVFLYFETLKKKITPRTEVREVTEEERRSFFYSYFRTSHSSHDIESGSA